MKFIEQKQHIKFDYIRTKLLNQKIWICFQLMKLKPPKEHAKNVTREIEMFNESGPKQTNENSSFNMATVFMLVGFGFGYMVNLYFMRSIRNELKKALAKDESERMLRCSTSSSYKSIIAVNPSTFFELQNENQISQRDDVNEFDGFDEQPRLVSSMQKAKIDIKKKRRPKTQWNQSNLMNFKFSHNC